MTVENSDSESDSDFVPEGHSDPTSESDSEDASPRSKYAKILVAVDNPKERDRPSAYDPARADFLWSQFTQGKDDLPPPVKKPRSLDDSRVAETVKTVTTVDSSNSNMHAVGSSEESICPSSEASSISFSGEISSSNSTSSNSELTASTSESSGSSTTKIERKAGVEGVLNNIFKRPKRNILEQSRTNWEDFKRNEGVEEELQQFNRGKQGYIEKMDFLSRTDLREFEIERTTRTSSAKPWLKSEF